MAFLDEIKIESEGWKIRNQYVGVTTSKLSAVNTDSEGVDLGFTTVKCYNANGDEILTQINADLFAVKTVVKWRPTYSYAINRGRFLQENPPSTTIRAFALLAPVVGNVVILDGGLDLSLITSEYEFINVTRFPTIATYYPINDANAIQFTLTHNAGVKHTCGVLFNLWWKA